MYFHTCKAYLSKSHSDMFLLHLGFKTVRKRLNALLLCLADLSFISEILKRELSHRQAQVR